MSTPIIPEGCIQVGNYIIDEETGEVIRHLTWPEGRIVDTREDANEALYIKSEIEADLLTLQTRKKALVANLDRQIARCTARLNWWEWRFGAELRRKAAEWITGKAKSLVMDYGTLGFRMSRKRIAVRDGAEEAAIQWANDCAPEAIKKSLLVSKLPEGADLPAGLFDVIPPQNEFYTKTGIKEE